MAGQNLYIMEAVNLICGLEGVNTQPGESLHLNLTELKLPGIEEQYADHYAGGAPIGIEVPLVINRMEATFNVSGWQPDVMKMLGKSQVSDQWFTALGMIRERRTGTALRAEASMQGRLGRVNPTAYRKNDMMGHEFSIRGIIRYQLFMKTDPDDNESPITEADRIYEWDYFTSQFMVGQEDINYDLRRILSFP
jgi:phage tail tube protein FII